MIDYLKVSANLWENKKYILYKILTAFK